MPCWCQRSDEKWPDCSKLKSTETQITTCYFQDMQKSIPESITYWNLMQMGYRSRRPQWWLPCQLRTLYQGYSSDTTGKVLLGLMSLDFCCDIWIIDSEFGINMKAPSRPVAMVQAATGGGMVWISWYSNHLKLFFLNEKWVSSLTRSVYRWCGEINTQGWWVCLQEWTVSMVLHQLPGTQYL